ncbi:baseplate J/gp47 family protein [Candidatus Gottesmanbacteria bacterium]|nr:baseplate J/gp47 family protein [Candidatus Gottesmanbacteria bacterium]
MKLPDLVSQFFHKKPEAKEVFLSLILDDQSVSAAAWEAKPKGLPMVIKTVTKPLSSDSWDERIAIADTVVAILDEAVAPAKIEKVVLGLPAGYLSEEGEILSEIRTSIKELTKKLEIAAIGFVPVHQAIAHTLKNDEGVPPTVILIGVGRELTVSLFKVGELIGQSTTSTDVDVAAATEKILKSFTDVEILPSRMLLYGGNQEALAEVQEKLLRHPWQTRTNFLHFPKIEILPTDFAVGAVCVAGATELAQSMGEEVEEVSEEEPNVAQVSPEELGFKPEDAPEPSGDATATKKKFSIPKLSIPKIPQIGLAQLLTPGKGMAMAVAGIIVLVFGAIIARWLIPHAIVTVLTLPQKVQAEGVITIEPTATVASLEERIIPAHTVERSVSGQSAIAATGKKKIGDPAKGTVTIFNKSTSSRSLKKGSVLVGSALQFTLDEDISVASASENLVSGTVTFGKANAGVTAAEIGSQGNLPAGTEFTFKDIATSIAIARNEKAFAGGTSRDITVVSRADYDALTRALTEDLVAKAKEELLAGVNPTEKLIDQTIETKVTSRNFSQEIDQEASQLQGSLTLTVTGVSYNQEDINALLKESVAAKIPQGYTLDEPTLSSTISDVAVARDGAITVQVALSGNAVPGVDVSAVQQTIAGKTLSEAQEILRSMQGIAGAEFIFRYALSNDRLPINKNNISVRIVAQ